MKLVFSEAAPDYARYAFPYVIWGYPEPGETPADFFRNGFLPSSPNLDRFYYCRQLRVPLKAWNSTSENRRVLRKGMGLECTLVPRSQFDFSEVRRNGWLQYAEERFGKGVMPRERLDRLMAAPVISHVLVFHHKPSATEVGCVLLFLEPPGIAYYYFAFYDLNWAGRNLGMFMMTRAVEFFAQAGFEHLHLGTCYNERALYKAQFEPTEFSNGWGWSNDMNVLKQLVRQAPSTGHLLEDPAHPAALAAREQSSQQVTPFRLSASLHPPI